MPSPYKKLESDDVPQSYDDVVGTQMDVPDQNSGSHHSVSHRSGYYSPISSSPRSSPKKKSPNKNGIHQSTSPNISMQDYKSDDEEEDLGRYSFAFNHTLGINGGHPNGGSHAYHGVGDSDGPSGVFHSPVASAKRLFTTIQDARMENRRKRLQRLLDLPDDPNIRFYIERCGLCFSAWCDILDKGMYPIIVVIILFIVTLNILGEEHALVKRIMLAAGIPMLVFRILWRPLSWFVCERRKERVSAISTFCTRRLPFVQDILCI